MRTFSSIIGFGYSGRTRVSALTLTLALTLAPTLTVAQAPPSNGDPNSFYYRLKQAQEHHNVVIQVERAVERYTSMIYYVDHIKGAKVDEKRPDFAITQRYQKLCEELSTVPDVPRLHVAKCHAIANLLDTLAQRTSFLRTLGRDLQLIATGYEAPTVGFPGQKFAIFHRLPSIIKIWQSSNDALVSPISEFKLRGESLPDSLTDSDFEAVQTKLKDLIDSRTDEDGNTKEDRSEMIAAVWRYQYGVKEIERESGLCGSFVNPKAGTDQEILFARFCEVEEKLLAIYAQVPNTPGAFDPPLEPTEVAIFPSTEFEDDNFLIWIRNDDIGLYWILPEEPVLPMLTERGYDGSYPDCMGDEQNEVGQYDDFDVSDANCRNASGGPVLGGNYVTDDLDAPEDRQLCGDPFGKRGYLCRPFEEISCQTTITGEERTQLLTDEDIDEENDTFQILVRCKAPDFPGSLKITEGGPNVCGIGGWRSESAQDRELPVDTPEIDSELAGDGDGDGDGDGAPEPNPDYVPDKCRNCIVDLYCAEECTDAGSAFMFPANENQVIKICIPETMEIEFEEGEDPEDLVEKGMLQYLVLHELVHAQQFCGFPGSKDPELNPGNSPGRNILLDPRAGEETVERCCAFERQAYLVQCNAMATDGILAKSGSGYTVEQCTSGFANFSCADDAVPPPAGKKFPCSDIVIDPLKMLKEVSDTVEEQIDRLQLPTTCEDAVLAASPDRNEGDDGDDDVPKDVRAIAVRQSLPWACTPQCQVRYANTIGNNMCFAAGCLEQSWEWHHMVPGNMPLTVQDEKYPFDSCLDEDPIYGKFFTPPALYYPKIPRYRPLRLVQEHDKTICQSKLLPARFPAFLCDFDERRRLNAPLKTFAEQGLGLGVQPEEGDKATEGLVDLSQGIGARHGNALLIDYLRHAMLSFAELTSIANGLLEEMRTTNFPQNMCPRNGDRTRLCLEFIRQ